ncbi:hypothetical protein HOY80DRAFT_1040482 [Tuber brumale]|nr:hypothetical protein HOY80DRAFT_1040482 [Tuber brumale]
MDYPLYLPSASLHLVLVDETGIAQPLPAELGPLPLYRHEDGYYSVLGPSLHSATPGLEDQTNRSANDAVNTSTTLRSSRDKFFCGLFRFWKQRSGPHTCSPGSYTCNAPHCSRQDPFRTKQALNRHYEAIHLAERFDCPVSGCDNVGEKGIKRLDNLVAHMKSKHGVSPASGSRGN